MKKNFSKVLAIVLSLAMLFGSVAPSQTVEAAKKKLTMSNTGSKNIKSGETRTLTLKGANANKATWSVSGTGKKYIKLSKKKGKKVKLTVAANATGKAKITAKVKKVKASVTYNLSCDATDFIMADMEVFVGENATIELVTTPTNGVLAGNVTYGVYSDEKAQVPTTDATVTPGTKSCKFVSTVLGTYYVKATWGKKSKIAKIKVRDASAQLEKVKQTKINELEVQFDSDASGVKPLDVDIKNSWNVKLDVEKVTVDAKDNTKATITTFVDINDGSEDTISYKGTTLKFQASDGKVASAKITPAEAPIKTNVPVETTLLDANGIELKKIKYGDTDDKCTFEISGDAETSSDKGTIFFEKVGQTAEVTFTYDLGTTTVNGKDEPNLLTQKFTIIAVPEGKFASIESIKFYKSANSTDKPTDSYDKLMKYSAGKMKDKPRVDALNETSYYIICIIKDDNGFVKVDGSLTEAGYKLEAADDQFLIIEEDRIKGVKAGKTSIVVKNEDGDVLYSIPIEIEEAAKLNSVSLSTESITLTTGDTAVPGSTFLPDLRRMYITALDQYNEEYKNVSLSIVPAKTTNIDECVKFGFKDKADMVYELDKEYDGYNEIRVEVNGQIPNTNNNNKDLKKGVDYISPGDPVSNSYKMVFSDKNNDTVKVEKKVNVKVVGAASTGSSIELVAINPYDNGDAKNPDIALKNYSSDFYPKKADIRLAVKDSHGTLIYYAPLPSTASITLKKDGTELKNNQYLGVLSGSKAGNELGDGDLTSAGSLVASVKDLNDTDDRFVNSPDNAVRQLQFSARRNDVWMVSGCALGTTVYQRTAYDGTGAVNAGDRFLCVAEPAADGRYLVQVKGVAISNGVVKYDANKTMSLTININNKQKGIYAELVSKKITNAGTDPALIAARAFRIYAEDTTGYEYDENKTTLQDAKNGYIIALPGNGFKGYHLLGDSSIAFNRLRVYVPYRKPEGAERRSYEVSYNGDSDNYRIGTVDGTQYGDYIYICREINVTGTVKLKD